MDSHVKQEGVNNFLRQECLFVRRQEFKEEEEEKVLKTATDGNGKKIKLRFVRRSNQGKSATAMIYSRL